MDDFRDCILDLSSQNSKFNVKTINVIRENDSTFSYDADASIIFVNKNEETQGCLSGKTLDLFPCCVAAVKAMKAVKLDETNLFEQVLLYLKLEK